MLKSRILIAVALVSLLAVPAFADRVRYSADPTAAAPQPATVITKGNGVSTLIFKVPELVEGQQFSFKVDMSIKAGQNGKGVYPATGDLKLSGRPIFDVSFDPEQVTFDSASQTVSVTVTLTVKPGEYARAKKVNEKVQVVFPDAADIGAGNGLKVIIVVHRGESDVKVDIDSDADQFWGDAEALDRPNEMIIED